MRPTLDYQRNERDEQPVRDSFSKRERRAWMKAIVFFVVVLYGVAALEWLL